MIRTASLALSALLVVGAALPAAAQPQHPDVSSTQSAATTVSPERRTALQKHVDFFDRNGDGIIHVSETYNGLRAIGLPGGRAAAWLAARAIHIGLPKTHGGGSWYQPWSIDTSIIHKGVHGSDSGTYDENGNYVHEKFLAIFQYDADGNDAIDSEELKAFHEGQDTGSGKFASKAEFSTLMLVAGKKNPTTGLKELDRETLIALYDGSLFFKLEAEQTAAREEAKRKAAEKSSLLDRVRGLFGS